jgi:SAM-dependent methyltransferase
MTGGRRAAGRITCAGCGAGTTYPWPDQKALATAYAGWYRPAEGRFAGVGDALLRRARGALARRLDAIAPAGRVLDVGAGDGTLLDSLRATGRDALGLELLSTRPDVLAADITEVKETGWAAVVFWHSLEHLPEPGRALARAAELLKPGGVLVVAVPNSDSLQARVFGDRWFALDLPRHLVHLPAETLLRRLDELGLRRRRVSHLRGGQVVFGWLHGLVGGLPGGPDLYDAIRRPQARSAALTSGRRAYALGAAAVLLPLAATAGLMEALLGRGGSVYVEASRG